jgi:hypothetical protein
MKELEQWEKLLRQTKFEFDGEGVNDVQNKKAFKSRDNETHSRLYIKTDDSVSMSEYTSNQYPFSDREESGVNNNINKTNPRSANSSVLNSPTSQMGMKKNYPLLTSVIIDLIDNSEPVSVSTSAHLGKIKSKLRSDSSKSDNMKKKK